ncbi:MAG: hypothetical protein WAQ98_22790 [Blastocatellia bacterium]
MDLPSIKQMLREDEQIQDLINLKSKDISENNLESNFDLDDSWEQAESLVINLFLDNFSRAKPYMENVPLQELTKVRSFVCILGFVLSNGEPDTLPSNGVHSQNYYGIGLSYLAGIFCLGNQVILSRIASREDITKFFYQNDLVCKALKHFVHTDPDSPYTEYNRPFFTDLMTANTEEEASEALKKDPELLKFLQYCEKEIEKMFKEIEKMFKL